MTIEEKAKAYDEALEKVRPLYKQAKGDNCPIWSTYEYLFPELTESEDERIRKEMIDFLKSEKAFKTIDLPISERWIAYLEKQKDTIQDKVKQRMEYLWDKLPDANRVEEGNCTPEEWKALGAYMELEMNFDEGGFNTKQEQKPTEWSEEYREEDLRTRFAFYTYKDEDSVLYLSNVFVEETSRNKGFGTKILAAAEKVAETLGAIQIRLKVKQDSPANAWYRKHGYGYMAFEDGYDWLEKNLEYMKPIKSE